MSFGESLRSKRTQAGLSRRELAAASGLARGTIRDYEQGRGEPLLASAVRLARVLGITVEELAGTPRRSRRRPA